MMFQCVSFEARKTFPVSELPLCAGALQQVLVVRDRYRVNANVFDGVRSGGRSRGATVLSRLLWLPCRTQPAVNEIAQRREHQSLSALTIRLRAAAHP